MMTSSVHALFSQKDNAFNTSAEQAERIQRTEVLIDSTTLYQRAKNRGCTYPSKAKNRPPSVCLTS